MSFQINKSEFGKLPEGNVVYVYTFKNGSGMHIEILDYGCIIRSLVVPDKHGNAVDVALGFDSLDGYLSPKNPYFGAIIGRYANRIAGGRFELDGTVYDITKNEKNALTLHGGKLGFDKKIFDTKIEETDSSVDLIMKYYSPDCEEGFPGGLHVENRYILSKSSNLITYQIRAHLDPIGPPATVLSLTNHSYFNLGGHAAGTDAVHETELTIGGSLFVVTDENAIPTGELFSVKGTPFDFLKSRSIGERINSDNPLLRWQRGYDHFWVLDQPIAALAKSPSTGISMEIRTNQPGMQVYTGNWFDGGKFKDGAEYASQSGYAFETSNYPDAPNHTNFPSSVLRTGEKYFLATTYTFTC